MVGEGRLVGNHLLAHLVPFETEFHTVTSDTMRLMEGMISITFSDKEAAVEESYSDDICGVGADLDGKYVRVGGL
jgi:hypothetical protein